MKPSLALTNLARSRSRVVAAVMILAALALAVRLVTIQGAQAATWTEQANDLTTRQSDLYAPRGEIVDTNGTPLALNVTTYALYANQTQVSTYRERNESKQIVGYGATAAAAKLAKVLNLPVNELGGQLAGDQQWVFLTQGVAATTWERVKALNLPGIYADPRYERTYPQGNTAGPLVGWTTDSAGAAGVELSLNETLAGKPGVRYYQAGARGQEIPMGQSREEPAVPGCTVHLSLNSDLQLRAQQAVDAARDQYEAQHVAAAVIEVGTGRVLALADSRAVDPNDPGASAPADRGAWSITSSYDPGSTGKIATVMAALDEGKIEPTSAVEDPYRLVMPNGEAFHDHSPHPDQVLTTTGVLAESANTGTVNIGRLLSDEKRYEYMTAGGWNSKTGIEVGGETSGNLPPWQEWDGRTKYATMFGQGFTVSLLQNTSMIQTVANQGTYVAPRLVKGTTCESGGYQPAPAAPSHPVFSPEASQKMLRMLESVTGSEGTGEKASVPGYRVAGKTGTAQVYSPVTGRLDDTVASFVGVAPAEAPRFVVGVVVYKPIHGFFGGTVAAPIFSEIASFALPALGVAPSTTKAEPYPLKPAP